MGTQRQIDFDGAHYVPEIDRERLTGQLRDVFKAIEYGGWHTVEEISWATGHAEASVSAQLRNLRKERFGGLYIEGRYRSGMRIFEYKYNHA